VRGTTSAPLFADRSCHLPTTDETGLHTCSLIPVGKTPRWATPSIGDEGSTPWRGDWCRRSGPPTTTPSSCQYCTYKRKHQPVLVHLLQRPEGISSPGPLVKKRTLRGKEKVFSWGDLIIAMSKTVVWRFSIWTLMYTFKITLIDSPQLKMTQHLKCESQ